MKEHERMQVVNVLIEQNGLTPLQRSDDIWYEWLNYIPYFFHTTHAHNNDSICLC